MPNSKNTGINLAQKVLIGSVSGIETKNAEIFFNALYEAVGEENFERFLNSFKIRHMNKDISKDLDIIFEELFDENTYNFDHHHDIQSPPFIQLELLLDSFGVNYHNLELECRSVHNGNMAYLRRVLKQSIPLQQYKALLSQRGALDIKSLMSISKELGEIETSALHLYGSDSAFYIIHEIKQENALKYTLIKTNSVHSKYPVTIAG